MSRRLPFALALGLLGCPGPSTMDVDVGPLPEDVPLPNDAPLDAGPPPEPEPDGDIGDPTHERWVFMQSHLHTTGFHACANDPLTPGPLPDGTCFTSEGITAFLDEALMHDARDMIITDHNNVDAWFDAAFIPMADPRGPGYATPLRGTEWSSGDGHMTLLFPSEVVASNADAIAAGFVFTDGNGTPVASNADYSDAIEAVHAAGGVAIINHPELFIHVFPEASAGADGVEVGIPPNPLDDVSGGAVSLHTSSEARLFWQRRLVSGDRMTGTAGADHHHGGGDIPGLEAPTFGVAVNFVRVDPALPDFSTSTEALAAPITTIDQRSAIVIDAIRRGHVMVVEDEDAARVFVGADVDGDGRYHDAREGDCVAASTSGMVPMRVRIEGAKSLFGTRGYILEMFTEADDSAAVLSIDVDYDTGFPTSPSYRVDPTDPFAIVIDVPVDPDERGFVRFVLSRDVPLLPNDTEVVTNPIYTGDWGPECASSLPLY